MTITPVAWMRSDSEKADCAFGHYGPVKIYPDDVPLYAIPETHRIVSVEILEILEEAQQMAGNYEEAAAIREILEDRE